LITIRDVADKAGVSVATVSRVMNDKGHVSRSTASRVYAVIEELGYKPNSIARSLSNGKSNTIALLVPNISNPFFPELTRAVEDVAQSEGFKVYLCNTDDDKLKISQHLESLRDRYVDGVIIDSLNLTIGDLNALSSNGIAVVTMDRTFSDHPYSSISVNHRRGGQLAARHLTDVGCQRIAHIKGPDSQQTAYQRMWGYRDVVKHREWFDQSWIATSDFSVRGGYVAMKELLQRHPEIDGVFAANDSMAIGALKAAYEWGMSVPDRLAIVGYDGIEMSQYVVPSITTIKQPIYDMGKLATYELLKLVKHMDIPKRKLELDVELIQRESTLR
jgi:LacI family transcriptional regulator